MNAKVTSVVSAWDDSTKFFWECECGARGGSFKTEAKATSETNRHMETHGNG